MGMYDSIRIVNLCHENFDGEHNNLSFQTQDISLDGSDYFLFNDRLYLQYDGTELIRHDKAIASDYSGEIEIYTHHSNSDFDLWLQYDLVFELGVLLEVKNGQSSIRKDKRDLSQFRPSAPTNKMKITLSVSDLDFNAQKSFAEKIGGKLDAIRELLEQPDATIVFPYLPEDSNHPFHILRNGTVRYLHSVVQRIEDFESVKKNGKLDLTTPNGDKVKLDFPLIFDEHGHYQK